jgi:hypothetical protein
MSETVTIESRYNGPPHSGNGGYSCGVLAAFIDGPATVRLSQPPPLDVALDVRRQADGAVVMERDGDPVGRAVAAAFDSAVPDAPTVPEARAATAGFAGFRAHSFPTCYVCGPGRPGHDGLELFTGPVAGREIFASPWRPTADMRDASGMVRPEIVWAALDCPGYFACMGADLTPAVLGELTAELRAPVPADEELVVYAWPIGAEGRKHFAGSAVADARGNVLACARSVWIELREVPTAA